jgi:hypothetical protein
MWRAELAGQLRDPVRWRDVAEYAKREFPKAGVTFSDVHSALAYAVSGDATAHQTLATQLRDRQAAGKLAAGPIVPALADAFGACARADWQAVVRAIEPLLGEHERIGGSRAQRDLIEYTLATALMRTGRQPTGPLRRRGGRGATTTI